MLPNHLQGSIATMLLDRLQGLPAMMLLECLASWSDDVAQTFFSFDCDNVHKQYLVIDCDDSHTRVITTMLVNLQAMLCTNGCKKSSQALTTKLDKQTLNTLPDLESKVVLGPQQHNKMVVCLCFFSNVEELKQLTTNPIATSAKMCASCPGWLIEPGTIKTNKSVC